MTDQISLESSSPKVAMQAILFQTKVSVQMKRRWLSGL